jgi:DNA-binding response OmpR family regulator
MSSFLGKRVLLVEDEMLLAMLFEDMLSDMGMVVIGPYRDVPSALAALEANDSIDIALLDIDLGRETSLMVADALVARDVPFLFATGFGSVAVSGYDDKPVLGKPFTESQLIARMRILLDGE